MDKKPAKKKHEAPQAGVPETNEQLEVLQQQVGKLTEALQLERADAVNLRRRHEEQTAGMKHLIKANIIRELLPVIDNFERALKHVPAAPSQESRVKSQEDQKLMDWIEGVKKILAQFEKTLADMGVERIKTMGEPFDPRYH